jgi:protein gp37
MSERSGVPWAHHTFSLRWGCTEVSPACDDCYAKELAKRRGLDVWGKDADRKEQSDDYWDEPIVWNRRAAKTGVRRRVHP